MLNKKLTIGICICSTLIIGGSYTVREIKAKTLNKFTVLSNNNASNKKDTSVSVKKCEKMKFVDWMDDGKVLCMKKTYTEPDHKFWQDTHGLISYDTKNGRESLIKTVNLKINDILSVSPNKKYAVFQEPRKISENSSENLIINRNMLDLTSGNLMNLNEADRGHDVSYEWISENKMLLNSNRYENNSLYIENTSGEILKKWNVKGSLIGTNLTEKENTVEGKIYIEKFVADKENRKKAQDEIDNFLKNKSQEELKSQENQKEYKRLMKNYNKYDIAKIEVYALDTKTDKEEKLFEKNQYREIFVNNNKFFEIENLENAKKLNILDNKGNIIKEINIVDDNNSFIKELKFSPDGKFVAYVIGKRVIEQNKPGTYAKADDLVYLLNLDTNKITKVTELVGYARGIENIQWNKASKAFAFYRDDAKEGTDSYIVEIN